MKQHSAGASSTLRAVSSSRLFFALVDQVFWSSQLLLLTLVVANGESSRTFGTFAAYFLLFNFGLGVSRALTGEVVLVEPGDGDWEVRCQGTNVVMALATSLSVVVLIAVLSGPSISLFLLAASGPVVFRADYCRHAALAAGKPEKAATMSGAWTLTFLAALASLKIFEVQLGWIEWWALWSSLSSAGLFRCALLARANMTVDVLKRSFFLCWRRGRHFLGEFMAATGSVYIMTWLLAVVIDLESLAAFRGAQTLFAPVVSLTVALRNFSTPRAIRLTRDEPRRLRNLLVRLSAASGLIAFAAGLAWLLVPAAIGEFLLGDTWAGTRQILQPMAAYRLVVALGLGAYVCLRAAGLDRWAMNIRVALAVATVIAVVVFSLVWDLNAALWVLVGVSVVGLSYWVYAAKSAVEELIAGSSGHPGASTTNEAYP